MMPSGQEPAGWLRAMIVLRRPDPALLAGLGRAERRRALMAYAEQRRQLALSWLRARGLGREARIESPTSFNLLLVTGTARAIETLTEVEGVHEVMYETSAESDHRDGA